MWMGRALLGTIFVRWRRRWGMSVAGRLHSFYYQVGLAEACPTASVGCCRPFLGFSRNFCYTSLSMYLTYLFCASRHCDAFPHLSSPAFFSLLMSMEWLHVECCRALGIYCSHIMCALALLVVPLLGICKVLQLVIL